MPCVKLAERSPARAIAKDRLVLATVRLLADQLDRAIVEADTALQCAMRLQLADELECLARALRDE